MRDDSDHIAIITHTAVKKFRQSGSVFESIGMPAAIEHGAVEQRKELAGYRGGVLLPIFIIIFLHN
jgi:hypothetical protein